MKFVSIGPVVSENIYMFKYNDGSLIRATLVEWSMVSLDLHYLSISITLSHEINKWPASSVIESLWNQI